MALPGKGGHSRLMPQSLCPLLGEIGRWFSSFRREKLEPQIRIRGEASLHCFQSWCSVVWWSFRNVDCFISIFRSLRSLLLQKSSKILTCIFLEEGPASSPRLHSCLWRLLPGLCIPRFPDQHLFEPALWDSGKVMEAEVYSLKTRNRRHRKACMPRSPRGPAWFQF